MNYKMINSIQINNFRGIRDLAINDIAPLTLISGKNNAGKSTILEALFLMHGHSYPDVFMKLENFRGNMLVDPTRIWEPLFYGLDLSNEIVIRTSDTTGGGRFLRFYKDESYAPTDAPDPALAGQMTTAAKANYSLAYRYEHGDYTEDGHFVANSEGVLHNVKTSLPNDEREIIPSAFYISPSGGRLIQELTDWMGTIIIADNKDLIMNIIAALDHEISDVFIATQNGQSQPYIKRNGVVLPLRFAGEGLVRLLFIMAAIASHQNSLMLIDEIENGFHYSMHSKVWEMIAKTAKDYNCQIIATTHSYENIVGSIEGVRLTDRMGEYCYCRVEDRGDQRACVIYDWETAEMSLKENYEVR